MSENRAPSQTRCRRCLRMNDGDPWYCPQCGKETTLTPHDGGTAGEISVATCRHGQPDDACASCSACAACDGSCGVCPYATAAP